MPTNVLGLGVVSAVLFPWTSVAVTNGEIHLLLYEHSPAGHVFNLKRVLQAFPGVLCR